MKKSNFTEEQIWTGLNQRESGESVADWAKKPKIPKTTFYTIKYSARVYPWVNDPLQVLGHF